jgi:putative transposase
MIIFGEASLRCALREYVAHYHSERNHQGLENRLLERAISSSLNHEPIQWRERLVCMLNYYYRAAV